MSRRLNWEALSLSHKRKLNIKDEQGWLDSGYTAHLFKAAEEREVSTTRGLHRDPGLGASDESQPKCCYTLPNTCRRPF